MTTVVFHNADYDGIFCREIARKFLPDSELIGWNFGDKRIPIPTEGTVYILDLPPDCLEDGELGNGRVIWIDHHKTSIEKWGNSLPGYRIDGVAACRLTWQWFNTKCGLMPPSFIGFTKEMFIERRVAEPLAVRLVGEYDVWDKRDPDVDLFQYGLRTEDLSQERWDGLLSAEDSEGCVQTLIARGRVAMAYARTVDAGNMKASFIRKWEGLTFLCLNGRGNSNTFTSLDVPETGHEALLMFYFQGSSWVVSFYHAKHRTDLDLSVIAQKYGGGGHKGACGCTCKALPFMKAHEAVEKGDVA